MYTCLITQLSSTWSGLVLVHYLFLPLSLSLSLPPSLPPSLSLFLSSSSFQNLVQLFPWFSQECDNGVSFREGGEGEKGEERKVREYQSSREVKDPCSWWEARHTYMYVLFCDLQTCLRLPSVCVCVCVWERESVCKLTVRSVSECVCDYKCDHECVCMCEWVCMWLRETATSIYMYMYT